MKLQRPGLQVEEESEKNQPSSSSQLKLPKKLPTIENVMKRLSAVLSALEQLCSEKAEKYTRQAQGESLGFANEPQGSFLFFGSC
jgi:hypothetical protein